MELSIENNQVNAFGDYVVSLDQAGKSKVEIDSDG